MVTIKYDENTEMMCIDRDGENIFEGNYWDFDDSPQGIAEFLGELAVEVKLKKYKYK